MKDEIEYFFWPGVDGKLHTATMIPQGINAIHAMRSFGRSTPLIKSTAKISFKVKDMRSEYFLGHSELLASIDGTTGQRKVFSFGTPRAMEDKFYNCDNASLVVNVTIITTNEPVRHTTPNQASAGRQTDQFLR